MISLAAWILWAHLLAVAAWLGGGATTLVAILPGKGPEREAAGRRAHFLTSRAMEVLVLTGILNFLVHGWTGDMIYPAPYFAMLSIKMGLLAVMAGLQIWMGAAWRRQAGEVAIRRARIAMPVQLALGAVAVLLGMGLQSL
jgi:copper transport protein